MRGKSSPGPGRGGFAMHRHVRATALVLLLLLPAGLRADEAEDRAIQTVLQFGGKVYPEVRQPGQSVTGVTLTGPRVTDADLKALAAFKDLEALNLGYTAVTDDGL